MTRPFVVPLFAALALSACAGGSADFVKEGATREEIRADNAACRAETEAKLGRESDITRDIRSGPSGSAGASEQLFRQTRDAGVTARYDRVFDACMRARGYTRR